MQQTQPFQKISDAATITGLSQYFLRQGCRDGSVPHVKSGSVYFVNVPALLRKLGVDPTVDPTVETTAGGG